MRVYVTFVVFTECERCTRPISTNLGSMEAGECGRTRGTCFIARRLEVVAVAGLLLISWCVLGEAGFFRVFFFDFFFWFERTRPAASMRPPLASFTSLLVIPTWWRVALFFSFFRPPLVQRLIFVRLCHSPEEIRYL